MGPMGRPVKFTHDAILDAAAQAVHDHGRDATIAHVTALLGAPTGSVYYRFGSREELFVSLWLRSIGRFHERYLAALDRPDPLDAAVAAARAIPRFCREHPLDAAAMTLYRQDRLALTAPDALREAVVHVNDEVAGALGVLTERLYGEASGRGANLVAIACQESPYGLVRRYLGGADPVPAWIDDVVAAGSEAVLRLGPPGRAAD